jgi:HEAT repeat protein
MSSGDGRPRGWGRPEGAGQGTHAAAAPDAAADAAAAAAASDAADAADAAAASDVGAEAADEEARYQALQALGPGAPGAWELLGEGLHDASWRVRRAAAGGFVRMGEPERAARLLAAVLTEEGETGARNAAAEGLVLLGHHALPTVLALLGHPDAGQRKFAADILGQVGLREAEGPLVGALTDGDPNVRGAAAEALGRVGGGRATAALGALLAGGDPPLQLAALEGLASLGAPPPAADLLPLLSRPLLRRSALRLLALTGEPAAAGPACRLLAEAPALASECLGVLGGLEARAPAAERPALEEAVRAALSSAPPRDTLVPLLAAALVGPSEGAARGAALVARLLGLEALAPALASCVHGDALDASLLAALEALGPRGAARLLASLEGLPAHGRERAAQVVPGLTREEHLPELVRLAREGSSEAAALALRALGASGAAEALAPLLDLLSCPPLDAHAARALVALAERRPEEVREALAARQDAPLTPGGVAVRARLLGPGALGVLRRALREASVEVRASAAAVAGELGEAGGAELARLALADEEPSVRTGVARGLARLGRERGAPLVSVALGDHDVRVRLAAVEAAGQLGASEHRAPLAALVAHPEARVASAAVRALGRADWLDGALLARAAAHPDPEVVKEALTAGAHLPGAEALAAGLLSHGRWDVRAAAARLLTAQGGAGAMAAVEGALGRETDGLVRGLLEAARRRLGAP